MSTQFSTTRKLAAAGSAFLLATAPALAARSSAYLPSTGPTPLRFETVKARTFALPPVKSAEPLAKTDDGHPMIAPTQTLPNAAPEPAIAATPEPEVTATSAPPQTTSPVEFLAPVPMAASSPAGTLPLITPQILAEFFRPGPGSTHAPGVSVLLPATVGFIPPMAPPPATSRATYKVE